jgi:DNA-binding MarR family transcriptional regulator
MNAAPERRLANLAGAWALAVDTAQQRAAEATALGGAAPGALVTLHTFPGQTLDALRRALGLSQPGTAHLVARLVDRGWVRREPGRDARSVSLRLTAEGERTVALLYARRGAAIDALLAPLDDHERRELGRLLETMLFARGREGRDPRYICRLCDRGVCRPNCPADAGSQAAGAA